MFSSSLLFISFWDSSTTAHCFRAERGFILNLMQYNVHTYFHSYLNNKLYIFFQWILCLHKNFQSCSKYHSKLSGDYQLFHQLSCPPLSKIPLIYCLYTWVFPRKLILSCNSYRSYLILQPLVFFYSLLIFSTNILNIKFFNLIF